MNIANFLNIKRLRKENKNRLKIIIIKENSIKQVIL